MENRFLEVLYQLKIDSVNLINSEKPHTNIRFSSSTHSDMNIQNCVPIWFWILARHIYVEAVKKKKVDLICETNRIDIKRNIIRNWMCHIKYWFFSSFCRFLTRLFLFRPKNNTKIFYFVVFVSLISSRWEKNLFSTTFLRLFVIFPAASLRRFALNKQLYILYTRRKRDENTNYICGRRLLESFVLRLWLTRSSVNHFI